MICFVIILTIIGLGHMIRHNCHCRVKCCFTCKEEEKGDINLDYGTYYSQDGERRDNIMEVSWELCGYFFPIEITNSGKRREPWVWRLWLHATWRATWTMQSGTIIHNMQSVKWSKIHTIISQFICDILTLFNKTLFDLLWIDIMWKKQALLLANIWKKW